MLDDTDKKILWNIDLNAKLPVTDLGKIVGMTKQAVSHRLQQLKIKGFITGQTAVIDIHRLGLLTYRIYIRLAADASQKMESFINYLVKHKYTLYVSSFSGNWDIEAVFVARNFVHFSEFFKDIRSKYGDLIHRYDISMTPRVDVYARDYLAKKVTKHYSIISYAGEPAKNDWDELDFNILEALSLDSSLSYEDLGKMFKASGNTIKARIANLTKQQIIRGYRTLLNAHLLGRQYAKALLKLAPMTPKVEKQFIDACAKDPCTLFISEVLGNWQLEVDAEVEKVSQLNEAIMRLRKNYPGVIIDFEILILTKEHKFNYLPPGKTAKQVIDL